MAKWRQDKNTGNLVPIDGAAHKCEGHFIHANNFDAFISPVDGSLIRNRREYENHNVKNNVVNAAEFDSNFYARKAKERADFYQGKSTTRETIKRKQEIYETMMRLERE